ncbi:MAG: single-stranded DNA-binding protein [bacterium]|nr:single-stranded DNA-binding protein [bacterium]
MNKVFLIGRLTRDPELRYTSNNTPVATFSLAVNRNYSNQNGEREADFINIVVWRKQAENVKNYIKQGSQIAIDGRIQTRSYDGEDGKKRYITEVIADNVQFLDTKSNNNTSNYNNSSNEVSYQTPESFSQQPISTDVTSDPFADFGSSIEISDDELPF